MTSAPCSKGGTRQGVAVVLSTTSDTPWRCAMSASFYQNDQTTWLHNGLTAEGFGLGSDRFVNILKVLDAAERDLPTKQLELAGRIACTFLRRA